MWFYRVDTRNERHLKEIGRIKPPKPRRSTPAVTEVRHHLDGTGCHVPIRGPVGNSLLAVRCNSTEVLTEIFYIAGSR